jgi:glutamyl-tRNA synthetase
MNTPKQILLYQALGHPLPEFAHVPMVLGHDRTRMSKRHGATSVTAYRDMGLLPDAFHQFSGPPGVVPRRPGVFHPRRADRKIHPGAGGQIGRRFRPGQADRPQRRSHPGRRPARSGAPPAALFAARGWDAATTPTCTRLSPPSSRAAKPWTEMAQQAHFYFTDDIELDEAAAGQISQGRCPGAPSGAAGPAGRTGEFRRKGPGRGVREG